MDLLLPGTAIFLFIIFSLIAVMFPVIALVSVLTSNFQDNINKLIWVLVILFVPVIGAILYFAIGRNQRIGKI